MWNLRRSYESITTISVLLCSQTKAHAIRWILPTQPCNSWKSKITHNMSNLLRFVLLKYLNFVINFLEASTLDLSFYVRFSEFNISMVSSEKVYCCYVFFLHRMYFVVQFQFQLKSTDAWLVYVGVFISRYFLSMNFGNTEATKSFKQSLTGQTIFKR